MLKKMISKRVLLIIVMFSVCNFGVVFSQKDRLEREQCVMANMRGDEYCGKILDSCQIVIEDDNLNNLSLNDCELKNRTILRVKNVKNLNEIDLTEVSLDKSSILVFDDIKVFEIKTGGSISPCSAVIFKNVQLNNKNINYVFKKGEDIDAFIKNLYKAKLEFKVGSFEKIEEFLEKSSNKNPVGNKSFLVDAILEGEIGEPGREEKRSKYKCGDAYVTVDRISSWSEALKNLPKPAFAYYQYNESINNKISLYKGDITTLEVDAVLNAANMGLLGGGGIDGAIHRAAGSNLKKENRTLGGCQTGFSKISYGHNLPARFVISTVGPDFRSGGDFLQLKSAYWTALELFKACGLKTFAFCGVSSGIFAGAYKSQPWLFAKVACDTVREWMETNNNWKNVERIIFVNFLPAEENVYKKTLPLYFPPRDVLLKKKDN